jgi:hypothetical protein
LLEEYSSSTDEPEALVSYLSSNSKLPSPRANLELLEEFSRELRRLCRAAPAKCWRLSLHLIGAPDEFVAMCGVRGVGQLGGSLDPYFAKAMAELKASASDSRWRVREAVAMSLQGLIIDNPETISSLENWVSEGGVVPDARRSRRGRGT